ncbi:hypothetical protein C8P68_106346 [Mucilaginibacter yixingensis]|uniref:O-antigen ligase-like membrane protein n=1 Tax=Mucilaginibacter yixingensis TaxID=1295612 RepID=A0A2T5J7S7_9SPHI|nr:hypothetical protein [Mucilaginibacter yixingensis]PTQ95131.1 hypothetical protein C8P68_106346 [Mucilaginibacter yixingensis]
MAQSPALTLKKVKDYADWKLFVFLVLFMDVKLAAKVLAIVLIFILQPQFRPRINFKNPRLPLFYPLIIVAALTSWLFNLHNPPHYVSVFLTGMAFWIICLACSHQLKREIEEKDTALIHRTLLLFFLLNAAVSILNLAAIVWEIKALNPYLYQGQYQKYFISTGDFIKGLTFDTSTTNAFINAFGMVYFLQRKNGWMFVLCTAVMLLTASNFTNILLLAVLALLFAFRTDKNQKSFIVIFFCMLCVFMGKVSPQNNSYVFNVVEHILGNDSKTTIQPDTSQQLPVYLRPDKSLTPDERRQKTAYLYLDSINRAKTDSLNAVRSVKPVGNAAIPFIPKPNLNAEPYQERKFTDGEQNLLLAFIAAHQAQLPVSGKPYQDSRLPGKAESWLQTVHYLKQHPAKMIVGAGLGNFSSKLAFRTTNLKFTGGWPQKYIYIHPDFLKNHLDLYLNFFSKKPGLHSLSNSPYSTYDQMLGEYGIIGLLLFVVTYLGYFFKHYKKLTYGLPILLLMTAAFTSDYWFEQLSILVLFELMLFLDIKEHQPVVKAPVALPCYQAEKEQPNPLAYGW